jgi:glycopeptide antibiotics resistance protein
MGKNKTNVELLLIAVFTLFVIYGTTIPFNFAGFESASKKIASIAWCPFQTDSGQRASISDIIQNIMLFFPIGFLWGVFFQRKRWMPAGLFIATLSGTVLSIFVETLQLFTNDRVVSITDVFSNTLGSFIGVLVFVIIYRSIRELFIVPAVRVFIENKAFVPLIFAFTITVCELLQPFDFSLDLGYVYSHLKALVHDPMQWPSVLRDEPAIIMYYMILTFFTLQLKQFSSMRIPGGIVLFLMVATVCCLECSQFIIMSRMPAGADVLVGLAGVVCGFIFHHMNSSLKSLMILFLLILSIACKYFSPFEIATHYHSMNWIPFFAEYSHTTMTSLGNVIELSLLLIFTGYCLFTFFTRRVVQVFLAILFGFIIVIFEFLQGFITSRFPDISDVLVGIAALYIGIVFKVRFEEKIIPKTVSISD